MNRVTSGEVTLCDAAREALQTRLDEGNNVIAVTGIADMLNEAELAVANLDTALANAQTWAALSFSLNRVKQLADRVTGLEGTAEYQAVVADLNDAELTYDNMAAHVKALNLKIQEALTPEFLATVTEDTELDLTSFITNPNIYNNLGEQGQTMPDGWICGSAGSRDNHNFCTVASGDGALTCYSWSGDVGNDVTGAHYYQKIGGGDTGISLPDGLYRLEALTNTGTEAGKMVMYATPDSVEFDTIGLNRDQALYDEALAVQGTNTVLRDVVVNGGMLYIGIKGADPVNNHQGGLGHWWNGDNFRLYYIGADVLAAYRERLRGRLAEVTAMCDSIAKCGIDVEDVTSTVALYEELLEELSEEEVLTGVEDMDYYLDEGEAILANWNRMNPLLVNGKWFVEEMAQEVLFVKPSARAAFEAAVQAADEAASDNAWDNWTTDEMAAAGEALATATAEFKNAVAVFFTIGKAKVLADQIGGLEETGAYQTVMEWLVWDGDIDALELQLAASDLQAECLAAMTPEVLATATVEKPFDMTTFIANPNIFQDAIDADDVPINTVANGWTLQTIADNAARTGATAGDTWLLGQSWSGNGSHNISSATNYRQIVGTQDNVMEEGKYQLPTGAYRVEAATFVVPGNEKSNWYKLQLYAQTNLATPHDTTNIVGGDSIYYTYTEIEVADSSFNDDETVWNAAQNAMGTTTVVPEIYVDNGAVTIGVRGNGIVGGTNSWFGADNFRLYYIGTKRGVNIGDVIADKQDKALSEIVDVYDITGQLVRKQVKRADAVKGLKKGIYVVDGQKFVVSGN